MNFTPQQKAWIILVALIISSGGAVFLTSFMGGAKWWLALIAAIVTASTNVMHAMMRSPNDQPLTEQQPAQQGKTQ